MYRLFLVSITLYLTACGGGGGDQSPKPTVTPTPLGESTATPEATPSPSPTPTSSPSPAPTSLPSPSPSPTPTTLPSAPPKAVGQESPGVPASVANEYGEYDAQLSDNFNESDIDWSKWTRRQTDISRKGSLSDERLGKVSGGWLRLYGKKIDGNWVGTGLSARKEQVYNTGFYVSEWRFNGPRKTIYHPSLWSANWNNGTDSAQIATGPNWLEIDLMEYESWPYYGFASHIVPRVNQQLPSGDERPKMVEEGFTQTNTSYTWGLEYHENYIRTWNYVNGTWQQIGRTVLSSPDTNWAKDNYSEKSRKKMYWILSNITPDWQRSPAALKNNSADDTEFAVNYFEYFPAKALLP